VYLVGKDVDLHAPHSGYVRKDFVDVGDTGGAVDVADKKSAAETSGFMYREVRPKGFNHGVLVLHGCTTCLLDLGCCCSGEWSGNWFVLTSKTRRQRVDEGMKMRWNQYWFKSVVVT